MVQKKGRKRQEIHVAAVRNALQADPLPRPKSGGEYRPCGRFDTGHNPRPDPQGASAPPPGGRTIDRLRSQGRKAYRPQLYSEAVSPSAGLLSGRKRR